MRGEEKKKAGVGNFRQNLLIWAGDGRFLDEVSRGWAEQWGGEDGAANLSAVGLDPHQLGMELNTLPMWSERQVVRLRQAEAASEDLLSVLSRYLDNPAASTALLVEYVGDFSDKKVPARWKPLAEKIPARSCMPRNCREYVTKRLRSEGVSITTEATAALDEWACGDLGRVVSALDLLTLYKRDEKRIEIEDLDALLGTGGTPQQWDLQDAFLKGDRRTFLDLIGRIAEDPDSVPLVFVGMLAKQIRALLLVHGYEARGVQRRSIPPKDLGFNHPYPAQKLLDAAGKWPESKARLALGALAELDLAIKGDPGPLWSIVERHLLKILPN